MKNKNKLLLKVRQVLFNNEGQIVYTYQYRAKKTTKFYKLFSKIK